MKTHGRTFLTPKPRVNFTPTRFVSSTHIVQYQAGPQARLDDVAKTKVVADASNRNTND